uniref:Molybdopterin molybdenumtransferase n=2 Tax=Candidatus Bipolaricaulota TaxID=67810 RepID=H5SML4_9BACT|nr:molybdopterin biosynthesis protein MoeA [uncultured Acetothermia bacterium]BAL59782.1 molybdopterin biosynthesis protein MoeA [Candidatus Acetothermum autotrophicum]
MKRARAHLQAVPLEEARRIFFARLTEFFHADEEEIKTSEALGRVTSRAVSAGRDLPHYASAAMDGIAVNAERTRSASPENPLKLRRNQDFEYVDTGDPVPERFDAVVKIEDVREVGADTVEITKPVTAGTHIRAVGEDFACGAQVVPVNFQLTPEAIAALLGTGNLTVWVKRRPRAIFIPTGSELIPPEAKPSVGQIVETNSQLVWGYLEQWGARVTVHPIVPNDPRRIRQALGESLARHDLILLGAGTSKGRRDCVPEIVRELGEVLVHGVAYHPGHPVLLGVMEKKPVIGLPGYPVATWLALHLFAKSLLERYYFGREREFLKVHARLVKPIRSARGYREFVRAKVERAEDGSLVVYPLQGGASKLSTLVGADGWIEVPEGVDQYEQGALVETTLVRGVL